MVGENSPCDDGNQRCAQGKAVFNHEREAFRTMVLQIMQKNQEFTRKERKKMSEGMNNNTDTNTIK